jgi:hypothetical protein
VAQTSPSGLLDPPALAAESSPVTGALSALVYRSRAVQPLSGTELHWLTQIAQSRNRASNITGVIVYDDECFYQWLEGPRDSVMRVMESIRRDPRHRDLEVLDEHPAASRQFGGWAMKLATASRRSAPWQLDTITAPAAIITDLRLHPDYVPALLLQLSTVSEQLWRGEPLTTIPKLAAPALQDLIRTIVVPQLLARHGALPSRHGQSRARDLAHLLIAVDPSPVAAFIKAMPRLARSGNALLSDLVEPAARALGDLWQDDECSEFDVAIGLSRLQNTVRLLETGAGSCCPVVPFEGEVPKPSVLVVPEPGERHTLGAALDSDVLWQAGWTPQSEFPVSDAALQALVDDTWFDALDLSLSPAFQRRHWLPRVTATIAAARRASRNPGLVVVVGGRVFHEMQDATAIVGADAGSGTAVRVDALILGQMNGEH